MASHGIALAVTVLSGGFLGFVSALVMYLIVRDRGPFVRHHSANALNIQIIAGIVMLISIPLMFVLVGFLTLRARPGSSRSSSTSSARSRPTTASGTPRR